VICTFGAGCSLVWLSGAEPARAPRLVLSREVRTGAQTPEDQVPGNRSGVVLDDLRRKYDPRMRAEFRLSTTEDVSIFVEATGVQVLTQSGWKTVAEDHRGEIWRLKGGTPQEVCVERPESPIWRAYVRYGTEMKGWPLFKSRMREAWILRSFSNWTGKAWGGGRWSGSHEIFGEENGE
jgi:hypothetical protein